MSSRALAVAKMKTAPVTPLTSAPSPPVPSPPVTPVPRQLTAQQQFVYKRTGIVPTSGGLKSRRRRRKSRARKTRRSRK